MKQLGLALLALVLVAWVGSSGYTVVLVNGTDDPVTMHVEVSDHSHAWTANVPPRGAMMVRFTPDRDSHLIVGATVGSTTIRSKAGYFESGFSTDIVWYRVGADLRLAWRGPSER